MVHGSHPKYSILCREHVGLESLDLGAFPRIRRDGEYGDLWARTAPRWLKRELWHRFRRQQRRALSEGRDCPLRAERAHWWYW